MKQTACILITLMTLCTGMLLGQVGSGTGFILEWDDESVNEDGFVIEYRLESDSQWAVLDTVGENVTAYSIHVNADETVLYRVYAYKGKYHSDYSETISSALLSDVNDDEANTALIPDSPELMANYPNPFNPMTTIPFYLNRQSQVKLCIYNVYGQQVKAIVQGKTLNAGQHDVQWDSRSSSGEMVSSGVYFACLEIDQQRFTQRITLAR